VGGARTALYNWLIARQAQHGKFVLRIEDTDLARSTRDSEESMLEDLEWLGLIWDEGPGVGGPCGLYRQSERSQIYKEAADFLLRGGQAYPCFCTDEELERKRIAAKIAGTQVSYDGTWRDADPVEIKRLLDAGTPHTCRFRTPLRKVVSVDDKVRGRIEWDVQSTIGDFVLLRSNGIPVYNFCVAVDDALMGVTTVVRAEEHLTNTVRQLLVLEALGFKEPMYGHASLILGTDKSKLSKRHGATSCGQFRERGYLPDAMLNYLALLGWNDGTSKEIYSRQELIEAFDLSRVTASPAMFDGVKLRWINGQHLRAMLPSQLLPLVADQLRSNGLLPSGKVRMSAAATASADTFAKTLATIAQPKAELITDITQTAMTVLSYPFLETISLQENSVVEPALLKHISTVLDDDFAAFARALVSSYDKHEACILLRRGLSSRRRFSQHF
jgi:glutamyl-tRNA synthetase